MVFDARMVYGVDGSIRVDDQQARKGDAPSDADAPSPPFRATRDTMLIATPVQLTAPYSRARTVSGQ